MKEETEKWGKIVFVLGLLLILGGLLRLLRYLVSVYYFQDALETELKQKIKQKKGTEPDPEDVVMLHTLDCALIALFFLQGLLTLRGAARVLKAQEVLPGHG